MIIKKYQAATELEAVMRAKEELGADAVIMNVKTVKQSGLKKLFRKNYTEVTAAVDDPADKEKRSKKQQTADPAEQNAILEAATYHRQSRDSKSDSLTSGFAGKESEEPTASGLAERLDNLAEILEKQMRGNETEEEAEKEEKKDSVMVDLVFEQLTKNEVTEANAREILREIDYKSKQRLEDLLANVYQKIVLKLGQIKTIELEEDHQSKVLFFLGPTGVGKTTTIAKLASKYKLEEKKKIALITADTYRIAAVEQIRTYANILSVPIDVVYTGEELKKAIEKYAGYDLIFVDTAGRSHKNAEQRDDAKKLINIVRGYPQETYLVLSATTKYRDLVKITQSYSDITNYRLLFTKIDETSALGNILNIRMLTNAPLSYTTYGQNVPDDIVVTDAQFIAKQLLGGNE